MPYGQPAQLANLRPWNSKTAPRNTTRRSRDVDKAIALARKGCPKAMRYALQILDDPEESTRYRLKAAEIILATGLPKNPELALALAGGGVEWLELRFVAPGDAAASETHRITFDPATDIEGNDPSNGG